MSDQALAAELNKRGISVARRTVAKYREDLRIPSTHQRRSAAAAEESAVVSMAGCSPTIRRTEISP